MRYGLPYKGSKNAIAEWIVNKLPKAEIFVDLFFGGGAVTHRAMLSGKYNRFIVNDIDARLPKLFLECAYGQHTIEKHPEWVTREEFNARKAEDAYTALVWSFGNNGKDYLYGADIEEMKHAYHIACYENNVEPLKAWGYHLQKSDKAEVYERYLEYQRQVKTQSPQCQLEIVTRQTEIERLQSLQSLQSLQRLQSHGTDFSAVPIPKGALIYCDIPYTGTNCGKYGGFDHKRFYEWAERQDNIFISEYWMPDNFIQYAQVEKTVLSASNGNSQTAKEKIYTNRRTYERMTDEQKELIRAWNGEQMNIEDLIGW